MDAGFRQRKRLLQQLPQASPRLLVVAGHPGPDRRWRGQLDIAQSLPNLAQRLADRLSAFPRMHLLAAERRHRAFSQHLP